MSSESKSLRNRGLLSEAVRVALLGSVGLSILAPGSALAQTASAPADAAAPAEADAIVVTGVRASIQSSIEQKRTQTIISDTLSASDIDGLPATNLGDAIATIPGATTHREKGAASEIAIGGLGPFLSSVNVNGRETTTGNGKRSVNFYLFPSELINTVSVNKTQRANLIEGGTSGTIDSRTVRPLDAKDMKIQLSARAILTEYDKKLKDKAGVGFRFTGSFIDQFDLGDGGELGIVLGAQWQKSNSPEELLGGGTTWGGCRGDVVYAATATCAAVTPANFGTTAIPSTTPFYLATANKNNIQFTTGDERKALIGALQWRSPGGIELNLDVQVSEYSFNEERQIFNLAETTRGMTNIVFDNATHILQSYNGFSVGEAIPTYRVQDESYRGGGFNISIPVTDNFKLIGDASISRTRRERMDRSVRMRTGATDIFGVAIPGIGTGTNVGRIPYSFTNFPNGTQSIVINNGVDITDPDNYATLIRVRRDDQIRWHENDAARLDAQWTPDSAFIQSIDVGGRWSAMRYRSVEGDQRDWNFNPATTASAFAGAPGTYNVLLSTIATANQACRVAFPQTNYLSSDANNTINNYASFDARCLFKSYLGTDDPGISADTRSIANRDVRETTKSAYAMATFRADDGPVPMAGNVGLRFVATDVTSTGLRSAFNTINNANGTITLQSVPGSFETIVQKYRYNKLLPSLNLSFDVSDKFKIRYAFSRSMTKPDPASLANGRTFTLATDSVPGGSFTTVQQAIAAIAAQGNPATQPLMSWNSDLSFEYYLNKDSVFALRLFHKDFQGGFVNSVNNETYVVNGGTVTVPVTLLQSTNVKNKINGFELSGSYRASFLPEPFNGLGFRGSWAHAESDFEQEDLRLGDQVNATTGAVTQGLIPPVGIFGLSKNVYTLTPYFQYKGFEASAIYKFRSSYFQQFIGNPAQNRLVRSEGTLDLNFRLNVNKNITLQAQATNITDKGRYQDMPVLGSFREASYYGATYFLGVTWKY
jgi:iron complex outermembrane recepter protein